MKRLITGMIVATGVGILCSYAFAQGHETPPPVMPVAPAAQVEGEDTLKAFRTKMQEMEKTTAEQPAPPVASPPVPPPADPLAATNPLGPAADLPVDGQLPPAFDDVSAKTPDEMEAELEAERAKQQEKVDRETFEAALKTILPMKPEQIRKMLDTFKDSREAAETPVAVPKAEQAVAMASLDTKDAPVLIKTSPNYVTTVTLLDQTGAPWPILDVSWAGPFDITPPEDGGHVVRITPKTAHGAGNISLRLIDMVTPITMQLQTGLEEVHYRLDVRVPKMGPLARVPIIDQGGAGGVASSIKTVAGKDEDMVSVLDGTPPSGAEKMKVEGTDGRTAAWKMGNKIYLRTPLTLLSPGWEASISSAEGMNVYALQKAPVVLLSDQGRMVRANIASDDEETP